MNKNITFEEFLSKIQIELNETENPFNKIWIKMKYSRGKNIPYDNNRTKSYNDMVILYEMYNVYMFSRDYPYNEYTKYIHKLNEGLILSASINDTINMISKCLPNTIEYNVGEIPSYKSTIIIGLEMYENDYITYKEKIMQTLNICGYYVGNTQHETNGGDNIICLEIEPKYLFDCTEYIYDYTDKILYHITLGALYDKIENNGLIPKAKNKKTIHPERIYMIEPGNYNIDNFKNIANNLYKTNGIYRNYVKKYLKNNKLSIIVLKIDLNKVTDYQYKIFMDPNHSNGVFVYNNIHPKCVDILFSFDI